MDSFTLLEPVRLYGDKNTKASGSKQAPAARPIHIGRLPTDLHLLVLSHAAIPDIPAYARVSRACAALTRDESIWEKRWKALGLGTDTDPNGLSHTLDDIERRLQSDARTKNSEPPPTLVVAEALEDDFGDFAAAPIASPVKKDTFGDFVSNFTASSIPTPTTNGGFGQPESTPPKQTFRSQYTRAHTLLRRLLSALAVPPQSILPAICAILTTSDPVADAPLTLASQAKVLHILALFLSPRVKPVRQWDVLLASLRSAIDRFDITLLTAFDSADSSSPAERSEPKMKESASASWELFTAVGTGRGDWELGRVWAEKREVFYQTQEGRYDPLANMNAQGLLDFNPMDAFIADILKDFEEEGSVAVRVFPPAADVLISFADRVAVEVIGEYISPLLTKARAVSNEIFLQATAAAFGEALRLADSIVEVGKDIGIERTRAEDVVYRMFESNMDEYLDEEVESLKQAFTIICRAWDNKAKIPSTSYPNGSLASSAASSGGDPSQTRFLASHNPAAMKRTFLASFTDALLLPVTIVPRTVGQVLTTGGNAAVQGISMLNPQRWVGGTNHGKAPGTGREGYHEYKEEMDGMAFEVGEDEPEDEPEKGGFVNGFEENAWADEEERAPAKQRYSTSTIATTHSANTIASSASAATTATAATSTSAKSATSNGSSATVNTIGTTGATSAARATAGKQLASLDLLLSLDVALELIQADREALKRMETFGGYPGHYGLRVREAVEEAFVVLLGAMADRHIAPGFKTAEDQMMSYKPGEHGDTTSVAPLLQFFELVHIGDMIQSMVQVYFDKEMAPHIDRTDFLNVVVREKKRFENILDDCVAAGLNAGTQVLMNQVEHIILTLTKPREYYPPEDMPLDLGPTHGCQEAIRCLEMHCKLLKGSTSKEVLEVFYQEVGIRLLAILEKHIKRQIISLNGGFQVIADLNTYYTFVSTLRVPSVTADFSNLKMLGHVFVVQDAKDLAQIVRDVTRYGGAYRPEDIYEFIQRRSDWKKIEKTVDKTMYNLSFKEDCIIC
ncbi:hypothetical protein CONPUDRAFT_140635 [Coniophora puteana RWD-64-598 SS2]|uniref:F-box domain-containing protein n=1 Tax=Coniophora puteana (strain RWD-64-598) TaxID=741705 RepID=R7SE52_CONPW|nr:uncharacterized protein CONPUDRAFT_140635 [Coniophora puteana RWD-64-598 SS2]EIW74027.1 hypothetical protein CONPUDRAFT_140635 [Coniophora puteana RWD-64-598 SS2]